MRPRFLGERRTQMPRRGGGVPLSGTGRPRYYIPEISQEEQQRQQREREEEYTRWLAIYERKAKEEERKRKRREKLQQRREAEEARRTTADTDERPINVRITNNSDYSIQYSIQSAIPRAAARILRLDPGTSADKNMQKDKVYGWPTLYLFYMPKSGPLKPIESYKPSKYIPNLYVTIENDSDILDIQYEESS